MDSFTISALKSDIKAPIIDDDTNILLTDFSPLYMTESTKYDNDLTSGTTIGASQDEFSY